MPPDNRLVQRRIHVQDELAEGVLELDQSQAHHLRDVLRLSVGEAIEVFDDAGHVAEAKVEHCDARRVSVRVGQVRDTPDVRQVVIASAVPKGERADWMVEKLSELGVHRFVPLQTARSVVHPKGAAKLQRWRRIATESAKQSRRGGVMHIDELTSISAALELVCGSPRRADAACALYLSTEPQAVPVLSVAPRIVAGPFVSLFIGPEGGWTDREIGQFNSRGLTGVKLTGTILRVETAAIAAAMVAAIIAAAAQGCATLIKQCPPDTELT
jgi:16S rRNA (uracil1498-N3)-methyltransferase